MIVFAHILGMPIEECVLPLIGSGAGAGMVAALYSGIRTLIRSRRPS